MKRTLTLLAGALAACSFAKDANSDFRDFYRHMLPKIEHAFVARDADFFKSIATPDFTEKEMGRTMTGKEAIAEMKGMFAMCKSVKCKLNVVSTKAKGDSATAVSHGVMHSVLKPNGPKDKEHHMNAEMWMKETWVRSGNTWKIKMIEDAKPTKITMDGKPFNPNQMGH